jgi:hypothetical protein
MRTLLIDLFKDAGVQSHIYSSNPDIEATIRANDQEGYLFIINHESADPVTKVKFADIGFRVQQVVDIETGEKILQTQKKIPVNLP